MATTDTLMRRPPAPLSIEETCVGFDLILQLVTKTLHFWGELTGTELAERLGAVFAVIEPCINLRSEERRVGKECRL